MDRDAQKTKAQQFADMHAGDGIFVMANAWDVVSARLFYREGFAAIATTSGGVAFVQGYPDGEHISREGMSDAIGRIARSVPVPVNADMEAGYGPAPEDVAATVTMAIKAGAVGINIEDSMKGGGGGLFPLSLSVERIHAAVEAARALDVPAVINARTDGFHQGNDRNIFDEAVKRANAYREAGAGCLFLPFVRDGAVIGDLARAIDGPVNVLAGAGTPSVSELKALGVRRVTVGGSLTRVALTAAREAARELKNHGTFEFARDVLSQGQVHELLKD
ncbi:MAG: isocitrate lyase/PEP mutase family protein [Alphaproteobacteria bacterium]